MAYAPITRATNVLISNVVVFLTKDFWAEDGLFNNPVMYLENIRKLLSVLNYFGYSHIIN
jgi:hypothetical protein